MMKRTCWFIHPDLGLGGAEMLVVNAAVALQRRNGGDSWSVSLFTSHHDPSRCFAETKGDGSLADCVFVLGDWLPRSFFGRFHVIFAILRMAWIALYLSLEVLVGGRSAPDIVFCDQVAHVVPLVKFGLGKPVVFYCHFPDKLLCVDRESLLKRLYRAPIDWLEEASTGASDTVLVNSKFTAKVFREAFRTLLHVPLDVLYPAIDLLEFDRELTAVQQKTALQELQLEDGEILLLSINRFERKKNLLLALQAMKRIVDSYDKVHLILAGGFDERLHDNVTCFQELEAFVNENNLRANVSFLKSFSNDQRLMMMKQARCLLYTPENEHFGIVPIESMYSGLPVVAVASGGPLETVQDGVTGFLVNKTPESFAEAIGKLIEDGSLAHEMGKNGRELVKTTFSLDAFSQRLDAIMTRQSLLPGYQLRLKVSFVALGIALLAITIFRANQVFNVVGNNEQS